MMSAQGNGEWKTHGERTRVKRVKKQVDVLFYISSASCHPQEMIN